METQRLQAFVQEIWDTIPRDEAWICIDSDPDNGMTFVGNRAGLLRLAAEFLAALYSAAQPAYLFCGNESVWAVSISDENRPAPPPTKPEWKNRLAKLVAIVLLLIIVVCSITGFVTLIAKLFG